MIEKHSGAFVETEIDDELVVMRLDSGEFFSLAGTAGAIWRLIDGSRDRAALLAALAGDYAVAASDIAGDVDDFLECLRDARLIHGC